MQTYNSDHARLASKHELKDLIKKSPEQLLTSCLGSFETPW